VARQRTISEFRSKLSEKLMDLGNLIIAALALGQFVSGKEFSLVVFVTGVILTFLCYIISYIISLERRQ